MSAGHRPAADQDAPRQRDLRRHAGQRPAGGRQPQRAAGGVRTGPGLEERDRDRLDRPVARADARRERDAQFHRVGRAVVRRARHEREERHRGSSGRRGLQLSDQLHGSARSDNNTDGAFSPSPDRHARHRMGALVGRHASPDRGLRLQRRAQEPQCQLLREREQRQRPTTPRRDWTTTATTSTTTVPPAYGRNALRSGWQYYSSAYFTYTIGVGKKTVPLPPGLTLTSSGGGLSLSTFDQADAPRYRVSVQPVDRQPDQPRQLHRLRRREDLAVLREADDG